MTNDIKLSLMVAMANNRCIGVNNELPWHLPEDLKHFKATTSHKPIIMGRKTYESIGRPLPNRVNIVLTSNPNWEAEGVITALNLKLALFEAKNAAKKMGAEEVVCIGGAQIYALMMPLVSRMYLTRVDTELLGDAFFPDYPQLGWTCLSRKKFLSDDRNPFDYTFECWDKN